MHTQATKRSLNIKPSNDPRFDDVQGKALTQLRYASSEGDFDLAWSIFRNNFDLQTISARNMTRTTSPTRNSASRSVLKNRDMEGVEAVDNVPPRTNEINAMTINRKNRGQNSLKDDSECLLRCVDKENVKRMLKSIPPGWKAPKIEVFRLLMIAFKNSNGNWDDTHFKDAEAIIDACYGNRYIQSYAHRYICINMYVCMSIHMLVHTYARTYICSYIHTYMYSRREWVQA